MRLIIAVFVGFGLLSLTSCSETQHEPAASRSADHASDQSRPEAHGPEAAQPAGDVSHEPSHDHAHHSVLHAGHHGDGHRAASGHETEQPARNNQKWQGRSHAAHRHSVAAEASHSKKIAIGDPVADFEVTINGQPWKLSELQKNTAITEDGTLVLTFWCSFCHSCRHVEHHLDALARQHKENVGVIALDASAGETTEGVAEFAKERKLTLPIALDASGVTADIFGTRVTTTTVVIDKTRVLRYRGQFGDGKHAFAQDALRAVLAGEDVPVQETRQKG